VGSSEALTHLRVIDLTRVRAGPTCVKQFADWGADVIKVEMPSSGGDDGFGPRHAGFSEPASQQAPITNPGTSAASRCLGAGQNGRRWSNYRPDVKHNRASTTQRWPAESAIDLASISGFGQDGPYRDRWIRPGCAGDGRSTGGPPDSLLRAGIPVADLSAGLFAALGILIALQERGRSGKGQWVQSSLLSAMVTMMDFQAGRWLVEGQVPGQAGNDHPTSMPTSVYPTADGFVNIAAAGTVIYARFCEALGAPELATDSRFSTEALRSKNRVALNEAIAERTRRHSSRL
jgi:formyl-CoA transferase